MSSHLLVRKIDTPDTTVLGVNFTAQIETKEFQKSYEKQIMYEDKAIKLRLSWKPLSRISPRVRASQARLAYATAVHESTPYKTALLQCKYTEYEEIMAPSPKQHTNLHMDTQMEEPWQVQKKRNRDRRLPTQANSLDGVPPDHQEAGPSTPKNHLGVVQLTA